MTLNGTATISNVLDFTDYSKTVLYTASDVTVLVNQSASQPVENVIASELGGGQYDEDADGGGWAYISADWRGRPRLLADLYITYADGTEQVVASDGTWQASAEGPTRYTSHCGDRDLLARG